MRGGASRLLWSAQRSWEAVRRAARGPGRERDLAAQSAKSALAALLAWLVASWLFTDSLSLMAPWVAVVLVQSTVYRSLADGLRQTVAIVLGTALATGTALLLDDQLLTLVVVLPVALLMGNLDRFGAQGVTVATSTIFALTGGPVTPLVSAERVGAAAVGAALGIGVNALVRPPRYLRDAGAAVRDATDEVAGVLEELAGVFDAGAWDDAPRVAERARQLPRWARATRAAWEWDRESLRLNVRRRTTESVLPSDYTTEDVVHTVRQLVDNAEGLARVVEEGAARTAEEPALPDGLMPTYARCLRDTGAAVDAYGRYVTSAGGEERRELTDAVARASASLERLTARVAPSELPDVGAMEVVGPLLSDARRMVRALDAS
ncbi:Aromatic acid exporter family member 1 [Streptomyces zhaozhouensis]|uniref:Aromatic acid exporter family member 1 n=1 Tax=Streptomyces zhaozhouensis TaxID=1300267 RepID=A0A286E7J9_9ACTN|nr:aromatic acid exporter family protein [Streptomyces zhaozhouensis]SOD66861.1 Aromatic acid exporter family member 1 [Streptomyces zhaozhouensis]